MECNETVEGSLDSDKDSTEQSSAGRYPLQALENSPMAMENKENIIYEEDEEEDEIFFGEVSEKEKCKAAKFAKRRTIVFTPGFRNDRKLMRYTMDPARLAALAEESSANNSGGNAVDNESDDKENVCEAFDAKPKDTKPDVDNGNSEPSATCETNGNNSSNSALDTSGDLFDSVNELNEKRECSQVSSGNDNEVDELINMVPKLDLSNENEQHENKCDSVVNTTCSTDVASSGGNRNSCKTGEQDNDPQCTGFKGTPLISASYEDHTETPSVHANTHNDCPEETPKIQCKESSRFAEETPTIQFKITEKTVEETPTVKKGEENIEETPTVQFKKPEDYIEETPTVLVKQAEEYMEQTPTVHFKKPEDCTDRTPLINKLEESVDETPTILFKKPEGCIGNTTTAESGESDRCMEETPTVQFKQRGVVTNNSTVTPNVCKSEGIIDDTPTVTFKETKSEETPSVKLKSMPSTLQYGTPRELEERISDETPTVSFKSEINSVPIALNSTKIGFKRSSTSAFQVTPRKAETWSSMPGLNIDSLDASNGKCEPLSPSVTFTETNFSPTLKVKDIKRPNTLLFDSKMKFENSQLSFDFHEKEINAQEGVSEQLLKPFVPGENEEQYADSGLPSTPVDLPKFHRGAWSLDSALRTTPELITDEPFPKLDFNIDIDSPGRTPESDMEEILAKKKAQLDQLRLEKQKIHQRLALKQAYGSRQDMSNLEPQSAKSACPIPTASSLPRVRYKDIQALSLASKELEAVTQLHTLTNSHRSVKVIKKPRSANTKHVTVVAREASRLQWLDTIVTPVTLKHMPGRRAVSATKPILTQRPTDYTYPYHEEQPAIVVVSKSRRSSTGGIQTKPLPLVDELETGFKKTPEK